MEYNVLAFMLVFKLCYGNVCKVELIDPPCIYRVVTYHDVKVGDWAWTGSMADKFVMIPKDRDIINICEVTDDDDRGDGAVSDGATELQQRGEPGGWSDMRPDFLHGDENIPGDQGSPIYWKRND